MGPKQAAGVASYEAVVQVEADRWIDIIKKNNRKNIADGAECDMLLKQR
jgi:hypothetical protein